MGRQIFSWPIVFHPGPEKFTGAEVGSRYPSFGQGCLLVCQVFEVRGVLKQRGMVLLLIVLMGGMVGGQLTNGSFEELDENRFPIGWRWFTRDRDNAFVRVTTRAFEGRYALYMEALRPVVVGVNRRYPVGEPGRPIPKLGALLPVKKGAIIFRYQLIKATTDNVRVYVIPMKEDNYEGGASRAVYVLPPQFSGDGKWHRGVLAFDFSDKPEIRAVQIGLRINEGGEPSPAAVIFDAFQLVTGAGWHLRLDSARIEEGIRPGWHGFFLLRLQNTGDEPAPVTVRFKAPADFEIRPFEIPERIGPGETATVSWSLRGLRLEGTRFTVEWDADREATEMLRYRCRPLLNLLSFGFSSAVLFLRREHRLHLRLANEGDALLENLRISISVGEGVRLLAPSDRTLLNLPPGRKILTWRVRPEKLGPITATVRVGLRRPFSLQARATVSRPIRRGQGTLSVTTKRLRALFPRNPFGYGVFAIEVWDGKRWRRFALSPQLLLLSFLDLRRRPSFRPIYAKEGEPLPNGGLLFPFKWRQEFEGTVWKGDIRFEPDGEDIKVSWRLQANREKYLLGVQGPLLFVGDNAFGRRKGMALLPGIYWLLADESSNEPRYADPPHHLHVVPHPYELTQPLMVVAYDGIFIGLMWEANQQWGEGDGRGAETGLCPQPLFASPNHISDQDNHLLGLMLPNVPRWVEENGIWAKRFFLLRPGASVRLTAWIIGGKGDVLDAYDRYFAKFPLPPIPKRPYPDEETFRRSHVGKRSYRYGRLLKWLQALERFALEDARLQRDDGSWGFQIGGGTQERLKQFAPHRSLSDYGEPGDTTVGTCTFVDRRATALLRYARVTGSEGALRRGMEGIRFIDRSFVRPEGAQTWEVPLHCPDVLAAANVIHTYLEAWQITDDRYWLERALYWAKTGLPFIYLWNPPDRPTMMRYASIPVFGASFFVFPWFGKPVQWNGLDYAYSLLKLAKALKALKGRPKDRWHDPNFWRHLAEGITICSVQQQAAVNHPKGNYPDSVTLTYDYRPNDKGIISPQKLVRNLWLLADPSDDPMDYETVIIGDEKEGVLRVTSEASVLKAHWDGKTLRVTLLRPQGIKEVFTLIAGTTEPQRVFLNDRVIPPPSPSSALPSWWRYDSRRKQIILRLHLDRLENILRLVGITPVRYEGLGVLWENPIWEFDTDGDPEGWIAVHDLTPITVYGGVLKTKSTGIDPYMHSPPLQLNAKDFRTLVLRIRIKFPLGAHPIGQIFWVRADDARWDERKSLRFSLPTDGRWHTITVNLRRSPEWKGVITQLRFDPGTGKGIIVGIDFLRLE